MYQLENMVRCLFGAHHPIATLEQHVPVYETPILYAQVWG